MTQEIAKKEETGLALNNANRRGFEDGVSREDLIIPRAKLLQALSPEVSEDPKKFHAGMLINSLTKEELPIEFVPVFVFFNWIRFNPRNKEDVNFDSAYEPGAMIWRSNDPNDPKVLAEACFGPNGERPKATKFMNFFSFFPGVPMPIIISFSNTSYKAGKNLLSLAKFSGGDMFGRKYKLAAKQEKNDIGTYFVLKTDPAGKTGEEDYKVAETFWREFRSKAKDIQVHEEVDPDKETETVPF
jgi:hypothetical protein